MRGYFGLNHLSSEEKSDILSQHKSLYNGYQTMQPKVSNTQPLHVFDPAGDKEGMVVNNKGEVKKYTNFGINEQVESKEVCDECGSMIMDGVCECNYGHMEEELDESKHMCDECGGEMYEGVCNECGYGAMDEETGHLDDIYNVRDLNLKNGEFDYVEGGGNDYGTFEGMHKNLYKEDREDMLSSIINSLTDEDEDDGFQDVEDFEPADEFMTDDDDFEDFEPSYTEDDVDDTDNEDDGFEDLNASEVTDGEMDEIDVKKLVKGKKYKYNTPSHKSHIEFDDEHEYPEGGENMYGFRSGKTGYALGKKSVEDFVSDLDDKDELELDEQGGNAPDMDISNVKSAYNFESGGPNTGYPVFEDDMYSYEPEKMYETMESAWADDDEVGGEDWNEEDYDTELLGPGAFKLTPKNKNLEIPDKLDVDIEVSGEDPNDYEYDNGLVNLEPNKELDEQPDISGAQGIYGDMKKPYDFDSNGPGIGGPYQHSSWGGGSTHSPEKEESFEEVDEDLKESFLVQKNKITEMFNRFKKYN